MRPGRRYFPTLPTPAPQPPLRYTEFYQRTWGKKFLRDLPTADLSADLLYPTEEEEEEEEEEEDKEIQRKR
ncbi:hypothetical protein E2C01_071435 [Portunus trituberculatus]|uniref:Uncharacterized protein n=1 Tax=Portunus trituberculatus TaxID=210409 RepID=A0A5B7I7Z8_PORTR|nr:hypothetical protein [Portunus trituberculatus]